MARNAPKHPIEPLETRRYFAVDAGAFPLTYGSAAGFDNAQRIIPTADGAIVAGLFSGTVDFDPTSAKKTLTARGDTDVYIASYAADGSLNWVTQLGGNYTSKSMREFKKRDLLINPRRAGIFIGRVGEQPLGAGEYVNDLAVDASGNIYLAGAFRGSVQVGAATVTADATVNRDFYDALVVKLDASGDVVWTRNFGGPFDDVAMSLGLDSAGNPYIGGYYTRQADFDPSSRVYLLTTPGRDAGFVMRLTTGGALGWVYQFTSEASDARERNAVNDIAVTGSGLVYFAGTFAEDVDFDGSSRRYVLGSQGENDAYLGLLNRKGAFQWALATGGEGADGNASLALDAQGNVYTAGYFSDEVDVDPSRKVTRIFEATPEAGKSSPKFTDVLVSKFASDGKPIWQAQMGGSFYEIIGDLRVGADGSVYAAGSFFGEADFAPGPGEFILSSTPSNDGSIKDGNTNFGRDEGYDWFVSRLSPRGKFVSAARFGGQDDDYVSGIAIDGNKIYLAGRAVTARGSHDDRQEQSLILLLDEDLNRLA